MIAANILATDTTENPVENLPRGRNVRAELREGDWRPRRYRQPTNSEGGMGTFTIPGLALDQIVRLRDVAAALDLPANRVRRMCPQAVKVIADRCYICMRTFWESIPHVAETSCEPLFVCVKIAPVPDLLGGGALPPVVTYTESIRLLGLSGKKPLARLVRHRMIQTVPLSDQHVIETASLRAYAVEWARREDIKAAARAGRLGESVQETLPELTEPVVTVETESLAR